MQNSPPSNHYGQISAAQARAVASQILKHASPTLTFNQWVADKVDLAPPRMKMFQQKTSKKRGARRIYEVWQNGRRIATFHTSQARREWIQTTMMLAHPE